MKFPYYDQMPANWDEASVKSAQKLVKQLKNVFEATFIEEDTATALADSLFDLFDECYQTVKPEELRRRLKSFINSSYLISDILKKKDETNYGIAVHFDTDTMSGPLATSAGAITIQIMAIGYMPDPLLETRYIPSMEIEKGKIYFARHYGDKLDGSVSFGFLPIFDNFVKVSQYDSGSENRY